MSEWLKTQPAQIAMAITAVLVVGAVVFALVWSIVTGQPLNPVAGNLIAFLTGGGVTLIGGQLGAHHIESGVNQGANVSASVTSAAAQANSDIPPGTS